MTHLRETTIIGGGIIGLSLAWNLARHGCPTRLLERDQVGRATSWAGSGILPPANLDKATDPLDQLRGLSHRLFPQWADMLESATGIDCGLRRCGGWYLAETTGERASMVGMAGYWKQLGIECEEVAPAELSAREPSLSHWASRGGTASAWWVPDEYQLRSPWYLRALHQACLTAGVDVEEGTQISDVRELAGRAEILVNGRWQSAGTVVLCCGAWISQIAASLHLERSVIPVRGQILLLKTPQPACHRVINVGQRYLVCREDGHVLVGSCEEEVGYQLGTSESVLRDLFDFAVSVMPCLAGAERIRAWSGLRPLTFDGFPMIGRVPGCENVYVAGGHFRSGLHLSPGTATVLTDVILGQNPEISMEAFRVGKQQTSSRDPLPSVPA